MVRPMPTGWWWKLVVNNQVIPSYFFNYPGQERLNLRVSSTAFFSAKKINTNTFPLPAFNNKAIVYLFRNISTKAYQKESPCPYPKPVGRKDMTTVILTSLHKSS